jgi:propanol-preferring alcohol dehydrogenase
MRAWAITRVVDVSADPRPLERIELPIPEPGPGEVLVRVSVCGICHTELDEIEGRLPPSAYPMIPGHQAVGVVERCGEGATRHAPGARVGVAWILSACGVCPQCARGDENLCAQYRATGCDRHGGYAEFLVVPETYAYPVPEALSDAHAAPLLCAGAIGYRSLRLTRIADGWALGLTGFGASAHLVLKMARHLYPATRIFVFARSEREREFALELGAAWAGDTSQRAPEPLDAVIDTTPAWLPVLRALENLAPGGRLVVNAIRKETADRERLLDLDYPRHLWLEKEIKSVANVTRRDVTEFLALAARIPLLPEYELYPFEDVNRALAELKRGQVRGAKVLVVRP